MAEYSPSPADWLRSPEARSVHVAGPDYEKLLTEAKSDREQAATQPELRGFSEPHHLSEIERDPEYVSTKEKYQPSEREMQLEADIRELAQWGNEGHARLEDHWDKVQRMELELEQLRAQRRAAWRTELKPLLESRMDGLAKLPFIDARSYKPDLARHPLVAVTQEVNLDRIVYVGRMGNDWSGRTALYPKTAEGGRRKGEKLNSDEYILETALDIATGDFDPNTQERDLPECSPVTLPDGELAFVMNGGSHRIAALKLLGRQTARCQVNWPA